MSHLPTSMTLERLRSFAYIGDDAVNGPIRAIILRLHAHSYCDLRENLEPEEWAWAEAGGLVVVPYYGPWSWMNRYARHLVDHLLDEIFRLFTLSADCPIIPVGNSMGGCSVLLYSRYAKRPPTAVVACMPACDLANIYAERPAFVRSFHAAFADYPEPWDAIMREHSPLHQVDAMPKIPYFFMHGYQDATITKANHSDRMVQALRQRGHSVEYHELTGFGHGGPQPGPYLRRKIDFVVQSMNRENRRL